jgi:type IV pilus assembly protein PilB
VENRSILEYLQSKGILTPQQANQVQVERTKTSKTEEQIIRELNLVDEDTLIKAKSELFNIPFVDLSNADIEEKVLAEVNVDSLRQYNAVPFEHDGNVIKLAMLDPFDVQAIQALERKYPAGTKLSIYITSSRSINSVLDRRVGEKMSTEVSEALEDVQAPVTELSEVGDEYVGGLEGADLKNAPVARIVNSVLQYAVTSNSSDIHIEPMEDRLRVRFRIHGIMTERLSLPKHLISAVVSRVKILSRLKIDEKRIPQDGRLQLKIGSNKVGVRVSTVPSIYGEKVVMRLLENDLGGVELETTGLRGSAYQKYIDATKATNGIILVTGPTGSGKTRTLAGTLLKLNDPKVNIITLEDPVEIRVPGVTQIQVKADIGLTFASGLRSILRQDPDIVMVGEIRDHETAELAVQASLTGHLVLSTLHTNSAAAAVPRLLDMGVESYLLASTLRCVVAQRLPRRICEYCKESYVATPEVIKNIQDTLKSIKNFDVVTYAQKLYEASQKRTKKEGELPLMPPGKGPSGEDQLYLYRGKGCDRCGSSGYKGRLGIFEVLTITEKIGRMMMENVPASEIDNVAIENGMITIIQDGYLKALEGVTTIEDVLRVSRD